MDIDIKAITREIFLSLWKIHILHHAGEGPVVGQRMLQELRQHGYEVSPGTMYPLLKRLERHGWLRGRTAGQGPRARRDYYLTRTGRKVLALVRRQLRELRREMELQGRRRNRHD